MNIRSMTLKVRGLAPLAMVLFGLGQGVSSADTLVVDPVAPIASTQTDWNSQLVFSKFNVAGATLLSVEIKTSAGFDTVLTIHNGSPDTGSTGTARTEVIVTLTDPGGFIPAPGQQIDTIFPSPAYTYTLAAGQSIISPHLFGNGSSDQTYVASVLLAEFTGVGTITLNVGTFTQTVLSNTGGNTAASQSTFASANGQVIYTFSTGVPEPGSVVLMGIGGLVFGAFAIRGRRKV